MRLTLTLLLFLGEESQFLFETNTGVQMRDLIDQISEIYNARLRIDRLCMGTIVYINNTYAYNIYIFIEIH